MNLNILGGVLKVVVVNFNLTTVIVCKHFEG